MDGFALGHSFPPGNVTIAAVRDGVGTTAAARGDPLEVDSLAPDVSVDD